MDIEKLEQIAKAATKGPWVQGMVGGQCHMKHAHSSDVCQYDYRIDANDEYERRYVSIPPNITLIGSNDYGPVLSEKNAAFIAAANPETVLALIAEQRKMKADIAWLVELVGVRWNDIDAEERARLDALKEPSK